MYYLHLGHEGLVPVPPQVLSRVWSQYLIRDICLIWLCHSSTGVLKESGVLFISLGKKLNDGHQKSKSLFNKTREIYDWPLCHVSWEYWTGKWGIVFICWELQQINTKRETVSQGKKFQNKKVFIKYIQHFQLDFSKGELLGTVKIFFQFRLLKMKCFFVVWIFELKIFRNPVNLTSIVKVGDVGEDRLRTQFQFQSESQQYIPVRKMIKSKLIHNISFVQISNKSSVRDIIQFIRDQFKIQESIHQFSLYEK